MMDINEIREYLPHRYPFLLVDRVTDLDFEAQSIRAYKNVSINEPFFNGHFPEHPIMPGVLIIEAMAQAGGLLTQLSHQGDTAGRMFYMVKVENARFTRMVVPGDRLVLHELSGSQAVRALAEAGRSDVLHRVYSRTGVGSYGGILAKGLTTMPETWAVQTTPLDKGSSHVTMASQRR